MKNPLTLAASAKGRVAFVKRAWAIGRRYGLTPAKMDRALAQFAQILQQFDCSATFPITTVALKRNGHIIAKYQAQGIEFAVHGYVHVDHKQLALETQMRHLARARQVFAAQGIQFSGFRCPYLRWNGDTLQALAQQGFDYDSSQALAWDVVDGYGTPAYERVLGFYGVQSAADYPALPRLKGDLVRVPYCIPDDEAIVDRLALPSPDAGSPLWKAILDRTYEQGELFTLGLHPERIALCRKPLTDTLAAARRRSPPVWIARIDEIVSWWRARRQSSFRFTELGDGRYQLVIDGPQRLTILARDVPDTQIDTPTRPWADGYRQVDRRSFTVQAAKRPWIGMPPGSSDRLTGFLQQQGYLFEKTTDAQSHAVYLDRTDLTAQDERPLLAQLQASQGPLVRLARWPDGARSALAVTGDIDALTLWDYGLRFLGR